ncbi:hypothetical protein BHU72_10335 [Desulfuribacillus stibiiarsenatis]|uniref:UPF0210 protein BHU72_10335 n=1 Tax=Desulfuribacillus stibiiarsenatis TaxID=1390249 RepID=A0A1E5L933_9FIRM|nr:PFL family protein [Desulfuribacillus stibiiarsenatis]OEH86641.1 hypothetical protein BHU72_10335 [Desulfuribacillus stibiiarsenatis]
MSLAFQEIMETIRMVEMENLDIRTVTMGISLKDCAHPDVQLFQENIYQKITTKAADLKAVADKIQREIGIPIINRRISITPIASVGVKFSSSDYVEIAKTLDRAAKTLGIDFIGGFSALVHKGMTNDERNLILSLPEALSSTERVCASISVATTKAGINMDAIALVGETIIKASEASKDQNSLACAKLVVFCNAPEDNPFMAGAFHGEGEPDVVINVGVSGPGVVLHALKKYPDADLTEVANVIKKTAFKITRAGELVGRLAADRLNAPFGIVDLSLAPTNATGDSVAEILEEIGVEVCGVPGTTAALALMNDAVKKGGSMATSHAGGFSGAFIPVSEDNGMIAAVEKGALTLSKLEAMTCVCSVGLDMIAVPGDTAPTTISGIIADESAIGMINKKTTAVRIIPVAGKKAGEMVEFGGLLGRAPIMEVSQYSSEKIIRRGGRIPAPIQALTN